MKKIKNIILVLMLLCLITGCGKKEKDFKLDYSNGVLDGVPNVGAGSKYFSHFESTEWEQEKINEVLQYRNTEILPAAEGENYVYQLGDKIVDIIVTGDYNSYFEKLNSLNYYHNYHKMPENNWGLRTYYFYKSPAETLSIRLYPMEDGQYELEIQAVLPGGIYDTFQRYLFNQRFDYYAKYFANVNPISQDIVEPVGRYYSFYQSGEEFFKVAATVEYGDIEAFKADLLENKYVKTAENSYRLGNLGCRLYDISENKYSLEYYLIEVPNFDYEHYTANYNNSDQAIILFKNRQMVLYFDNGTLYINPIRQLGVPIDRYRVQLKYDREGIKNPAQLHVYHDNPNETGGAIYNFILEFNYYDHIVELVEDQSYFVN